MALTAESTWAVVALKEMAVEVPVVVVSLNWPSVATASMLPMPSEKEGLERTASV
jgi:hypothetical protein